MSVLFGKRRRQVQAPKAEEPKPSVSSSESDGESPSNGKNDKVLVESADSASNLLISFLNLGVDPWLVKRCELLGIRHPTPVQAHCIPPILAGRDVIGCAQTGSGKTAAFALPILYTLSQDPYGPYALVLTPTRELAFQIADQFNAFGSSMAVRCTVIVGGVDMLKQSLALRQRPHIIVATPGRFRDHLLRVDPPNISLVKYVVLDEADRLLDVSFAKDLSFIFDKLPAKRQTLLFSATMTANLDRLEQTALSDDAFRFDATPSVKTVATLKQFYLFIPAQVKMTYLMYLMKMLDPSEDEDEEQETKKNYKPKIRKGKKDQNLEQLLEAATSSSKRQLRSMMIFVSTCKMCELVGEIGSELGTKCVTLHSMMSQNRRLAALGKFKSGLSHILISTDVASRGLDIPEVDVVLNFDLPRDADDYIHRVGRTARAGRSGQAISLVTQHDIELLQNIEAKVGKKMDDYEAEAPEKKVLKLLNDVTTATRVAKMKLTERGFDDKVHARKAKRQEQQHNNSGGNKKHKKHKSAAADQQ
ncbi:putative ATP-dependent RNA helicase [Phytophthora rubi]|uniref:Putative ATP-dependent RNA helicase n=1 Tax=Phytophthora rubi TaxID=129364 RepID=A0A6A4G6L0_9STRA|nr:putative ATP-dependent RNA helicase [Phytophthora rubi]KAE9052129.1 putative ATP-dependent RNA helicase [Phytophthora rubi]KAE9359362.1 putative ATP-dependent RNA helicase [Phytophthora rubi]